MSSDCPFCRIVRGTEPASIVCENDLVVAFVDLRQFSPGHVLVVPRRHLPDVRELDDATGAAVMSMLTRVTRAVGEAFANEGLGIWHSIGEAAGQEVPHLHFHVHPRRSATGCCASIRMRQIRQTSGSGRFMRRRCVGSWRQANGRTKSDPQR
ncbi:HIT family protein [Lysobacter sp. A378]